jgi:2-keto-4-pentenoate hydratase
MEDRKAQAASDLLFELWRTDAHITQLPEDLRPADEDEGYQIQSLLERRTSRALFGWKIAATSSAGQAHIHVEGPLVGRILPERVLADGGVCTLGANLMRVAELEFAFRMRATLAPRASAYNTGEVLAAVESLHPSIEVPDARLSAFESVGAAQLIADNACAHLFAPGPAADECWRTADLADWPVVGILNENTLHHGVGRNVLGDPRTALTWLVNRLSRLGLPLQAGQTVTTGTCITPIPVAPGDVLVGDFGALGTVSLRFA